MFDEYKFFNKNTNFSFINSTFNNNSGFITGSIYSFNQYFTN